MPTSKRKERIARAKSREPIETEKLRIRERAKIPSKVARFLAGPLKGHSLAEVIKQQEEAKEAARLREIVLSSKESK